jgi:uncharacterized protein YbjT (DUF2867 family)
MILVSGATGTVGSSLVRLLAGRGVALRAMTRDPSRATVPAGVQLIRADLTDPATLAGALAGVDAVFLLAPPGPAQPEHDLALIAAARAAGVARAVKLSAIGTGLAEHPEIGEWHLPGEEALRASGMAWTVLRPTTFASNLGFYADAIRAGVPVPNPFGAGAQGVVDPRDVAAVAAATLTGTGHEGAVYTLTGPELLTFPEQVAVIGEITGRSTATVDLSPDEHRAQLLASGADPAYVEKILAGSRFVRDGHNAVVTDDVAQITGRPAGSLAAWVRAHLATFA